MQANNILSRLEERAKEQQLLRAVPFEGLFIFLSRLLGENPWKIIIPFSFIITLILQLIFGRLFDETILTLFGYI